MKSIFILLAFFLAAANMSLRAQLAPPMSVHLDPRDSIFVLVKDNQKYLTHSVKAGQSLYSISRFYHVTVDDIQAANGLAEPKAKANQVLLIPISVRAIARRRPDAKHAAEFLPVYYHVKEKETLYRIGKVYFNTPVDTLAKRNKLKTMAVSTGQALHVGWFSKAGVPDSLQNGFQSEAQKAYLELKNKYDAEKATKKELVHEGTAYWQKDDRKASSSAFFALHDLAPVGSVLRVFNPRSQVTIYVKVLGGIPKTEKTENAVVFLSPAAAKALGAIDPKFYVKIHYLK